jgi:glycosyltransferase involved in cell wall biosynthesis
MMYRDLVPVDPATKLGDIAAAAGLRSVEIVAWRDLQHPEAGGSEVHAARIAERWASGGIDVQLSASRAPGTPRSTAMDGYRIDRPAGRYGIFPSVGLSRLAKRGARPDATVEIWNGMPFFSPLWARKARAVFFHHVHGDMWDLVLPSHLATVGKFIERRLAPPLYRHTPIVTLSESSRRTIVDVLGMSPDRVTVVEPGVEEHFRPGTRSTTPLVVAVGRLVTYKRFDRLIETLVGVHRRHPALRVVIAGEGTERSALEALISRHDASSWISMPGRVDDEALVDLYQSAWLLLSTSAYEGWGLTVTEAAACGTPAVVSPIPGHSDSVSDGISGFLAEPGPEMEARIDEVLTSTLLRRRLERGALARAAHLTWDRTAIGTMRVLADEAVRRQVGNPPGVIQL